MLRPCAARRIMGVVVLIMMVLMGSVGAQHATPPRPEGEVFRGLCNC